ncbi:PAS domain-containing protein [Sulfurimonas sp. SWIR-19]|uniref:PAS domain-containing protein n=1 Tax=Sulfurimonas sp. SWIR-19 TaxID=2878390 RepID=UPI001CF1BDBD|nr:PAS domain-containing protein [Sulfurimonas sp. SWIR-19]UCN01232.1 PAS domain-containing protein [Sulfurimonas sp. SWIR-19]
MEIQMKQDELIVSKTDTKGRITYGNFYFISISGYSEQELLNAPHNILRHPDMPRVIFKLLWDRIQAKKYINAYVKNLTKNGDYYWVFANVTASLDVHGNIVGYYSVRRAPSVRGINIIEKLYKELRQAEASGGISASLKILEKQLQQEGQNYDEFILNLQK